MSNKKMSTDIFINKSTLVHKDKYDYSLVEYINNHTKVKIICKEHGIFEQSSIHHIIRGQGCKKCGLIKLSKYKTCNSTEFIEKSIKLYEDKFDYSKVEYLNVISKIIIICKEHGEFEITPNEHLGKYRRGGCSLCNGSILNTKTFIEKANKVHKDKYDYSMVCYKHSQKYVLIICKEHGEFLQKPNCHLQGQGCMSCRLMDTNSFIKKSISIHDNRYDYSYTKYISTNKKVDILCKTHNEIFSVTPNLHLSQKQGCPLCSGTKLNTKTFIEKSKIIHGDIFGYSNSKYINNITNVIVTCKEHGDFLVNPNNHLSHKQGCKKCNSIISKGETIIKEYIKNLNIEYTHQHIFNDCKYKKKLRFDFYLPTHNVCIEYDGEQHYKPVDKFGGFKEFKNTQIRDNIKNEYCKNNNIKLIRIPYYDLLNINNILNEKLYNINGQ